jgi:hypothetical protein
MNLYSHHRRKLFLLHWIATSTSGCGTCLALVDLIFNLGRAIVPTFIDPGFSIFLFLALQLICVSLICNVQQMILRRAGYPDTPWVMATVVGFVATLFSFPLLLVLFGCLFSGLAFPNKDFVSEQLFALAVGGTIGFVQSFAFRISRWQQIAYALSCGSAICVVVLVCQLQLLSKSSWTEIGMLVGAIYGVLSGGCLAWILPANSEVAAELRYFGWLRNRRFMQKVSFEFLRSS